VVAVYYGYQSLVKNIQVSLPFMQLVTDHSLLVPMLEGLLVLGLALGALGSLISLRKFLNA